MTEWQSRATRVLIDQLGVKDARYAHELSGKFERGEMLRLEEVELMTKVIGIIGAVAAIGIIVRPTSTTQILQAQNRTFADTIKAARGRVRCGAWYPLFSADNDGCYLDHGHNGLHIDDYGFAWNKEDAEWARAQMDLINE